MLLELEEVSRDEPNNDGIILLSWAAWEVHEAIMKCYFRERKSTPTIQIITAKHGAGMPFEMDLREWMKYYSSGQRLTQTNEITMGTHRSWEPLSGDTRRL